MNTHFLKPFLELYVKESNQNHLKQRCRTAPDREFSKTGIENLVKKAGEFDIGVSLCNWVKSELKLNSSVETLSRRNGFQCLGYQNKLFKNAKNV